MFQMSMTDGYRRLKKKVMAGHTHTRTHAHTHAQVISIQMVRTRNALDDFEL